MANQAQLLIMGDPLTIKGILIPEDWDESNRITKMVICTATEQEYLIEMNALGKELAGHKGLKAVLKGVLTDTGVKRKTIVVDQYEIQPW